MAQIVAKDQDEDKDYQDEDDYELDDGSSHGGRRRTQTC